MRPIAAHRLLRAALAHLSPLLPAGVAIAWVPLRSTLPNTDVALILVATIPLTAWLNGRLGAMTASVTAAITFEFFETKPYETLWVIRAKDVVTTVLIMMLGLLIAELTLRLSSHRSEADQGRHDLAILTETAELIAVGDDANLVVKALAGELSRLLDLNDCEYVTGAPPSTATPINRDGSTPGPRSFAPGRPLILALLVWLQGEQLGYYRLVLSNSEIPPADRLAIAVSLADQAGAAIAAAQLPTPDPPGAGRLRVIDGGSVHGVQSPFHVGSVEHGERPTSGERRIELPASEVH